MDHSSAHRIISDYSPPLANFLRDTERAELERAGSEAIDRWKDSTLPGAVAPTELGGEGASLDDMITLQSALGYFSPSLAAATTMHHLSMLSLVDFGQSTTNEDDRETVVALISSHAVLASAFSESIPGGSVFAPSMTGRTGSAGEDGPEAEAGADAEATVVLDGRKAPCSLSHSMDFLMASYLDENERRAVALVPADTEGVSVTDIWDAPVLKGSQSEMVVFDHAQVPASLTFQNDDFDPDGSLEKAAYQIFGLLISAAYLGAARRAINELDDGGPLDDTLLVEAEARIAAHTGALRYAALRQTGARVSDADIADLLLTRTSLKSALADVVALLSRLRGGRRYSSNADLNYFIEVLHAYEYHPPSRVETVSAVRTQETTGSFSYTDTQ